MGQSTDGQICYGISFEADHEFPWGVKPFDGDITDWWRATLGYKPPFQLYNAKGEYLNGVKPTKKQSQEYYDHKCDWDAAHPLPVELVNTCSGDYPQWILAIPGTFWSANRGHPVKLTPEELVVKADAVADLVRFCVENSIAYDEAQLGWWLSSYWG